MNISLYAAVGGLGPAGFSPPSGSFRPARSRSPARVANAVRLQESATCIHCSLHRSMRVTVEGVGRRDGFLDSPARDKFPHGQTLAQLFQSVALSLVDAVEGSHGEDHVEDVADLAFRFEDLGGEEDGGGDHDFDLEAVRRGGTQLVVVVHGGLRAGAGEFQQQADFLHEAQRTVQTLQVLRSVVTVLSLHPIDNIIQRPSHHFKSIGLIPVGHL